MINTLKLRGFQSHETTEVSFHPNLTCIIGATDSGKSSLLRGPRLVFENKPAGNEFIRNGYDTTDVDIEFDDTVVSRTKGKVNSYTVDGEVLKAFGQSVPDTANNKMRIDAGLCIQRQSSPYFLLGNTPSERARLVDGFCDISIASLSAANARKQALRADRQADTLRETLAPQKARQAALKEFETNRPLVERIEKGVAKLASVVKTCERLDELSVRLCSTTTAIASVDGMDIAIDDSVTQLESLLSEYKQVVDVERALSNFHKKMLLVVPTLDVDVSSVDQLYRQYTDTRSAIAHLNKAIATLSVPIPVVDIDFASAQMYINDYGNASATIGALQEFLKKYDYIQETLVDKKQALLDIDTELAKIPNCPLCGSELCNDHS